MDRGITIVGLGPGDANLLTREAWTVLSEASQVYLRTGIHPVVETLPSQLKINTFDRLYDELDSFEAVYAAIVDQLIELASNSGSVLYGVPGDPTVGEATVVALRRRAKESEIPLRVVHGLSFCEPCLHLLGVDALDGLVVADALNAPHVYAVDIVRFQADINAGEYLPLMACSQAGCFLLRFPEHDHCAVHAAPPRATPAE